MRKKFLIILNIFFFSNVILLSEIRSQINNEIIVRVGGSIVSTFDVQNEIVTSLVLKKQEISQENIDNQKNFAIKRLINKLIKKNEIKKFEIEDYSQADLKNYTKRIAKSLDTNENGLKEIFKKYSINYDTFIENYKTELLWNTLIFKIYGNQINVNVIDVENEVKKFINIDKVELNLSEIEISNSQYNENKLQEILEVVKREGFNIAAKRFSVSVTAEKEGLIGWVLKETLSKKYLAEIKKMKVKEISAPISNKNSMSLLMINEIREKGGVEKVDQIKKKILLKRKEEKLSLFSRSHFSNLENTIQINF